MIIPTLTAAAITISEWQMAIIIILTIIAVLILLLIIVLIAKKSNRVQKNQLKQQSIVMKHLIETVEELRKVATPSSEPKEKVIVKKEQIKKQILTKEQIEKRDAKRKELAKKAQELSDGKKITAEELKKIKLTDLYGIAEKRAAYFTKNGKGDILKLSKMTKQDLTKSFVEEFPALKSWTSQMKLIAIESNIKEAKYMVQTLLK